MIPTFDRTIRYRDPYSFDDIELRQEYYMYESRSIVGKPQEELKPKKFPVTYSQDCFIHEIEKGLPENLSLSKIEVFMDHRTGYEVFRCLVTWNTGENHYPIFQSDFPTVLNEHVLDRIKKTLLSTKV